MRAFAWALLGLLAAAPARADAQWFGYQAAGEARVGAAEAGARGNVATAAVNAGVPLKEAEAVLTPQQTAESIISEFQKRFPNDHPVTTLGRIQQAVDWTQVTPEEQDALYRALGLK